MGLGLIYSCQKTDVSIETLSIPQPQGFPEVVYPLHTNPLSQEGVDLGKQLFNDPILSIDGSVACSNCHTKSLSFTDAQHHPSIGIFERVGTRDAPPIMNLAFRREFFWDGSVSQLDFVPLAAIENELEMGESLGHVVSKLNDSESYSDKFRTVFPTMDTITGPLMLKALSQYLLTLVSADSRYDQYQRGEIQLTDQERRGLVVFEENCTTCHVPPLFTNEEFLNNGLDTVFSDLGREGITESSLDRGKFIVPSLRNIGLTAPYMHDGRFKTLEEVLDFYDSDVLYSFNLAEELNQNGRLGIALSSDEKADLLAFLSTLTDYNFINNPKF